MKVFVAGASGAIGRPLLRQLVAAGHEVTGTTRREERAGEIRAGGAAAAVLDVFDRAALEAAVRKAAPEVVVNQLTSLPQRYDPRRASFYEATNRVRGEGGRNLIEAARAAGARRFLTQSISFLYAPEGDWVKDEEARAFDDAPGHFGPAVRVLLEHERQVTASTTPSTTSRHRCASGCPSMPRRWEQSRPSTCPSGSPGSSLARRSRRRRSSCAAPPTPRQGASSPGGPAARVGARGSVRRSDNHAS